MELGATFSEDRCYRYSLWRIWNRSAPLCNYILLNPSDADEHRNDPTVTRCIARGLRDGFGGVIVTNLFGWISTNPSELACVPDPVGEDNDERIRTAAVRSLLVVCGWGKLGSLNGRDAQVLRLLQVHGVIPYTLVINSDGSPRHPLYIPYKKKPFVLPWKPGWPL